MFTSLIALIFATNTMTFSKADILIEKHEVVIEKLIQCESGGKENAIHKLDGDGTDSVGVLQFKWKTFSYYSQKFGLFQLADEADMQNLWRDRYAQRLVAAYMIDGEKNWKSHWKVCSKNI